MSLICEHKVLARSCPHCEIRETEAELAQAIRERDDALRLLEGAHLQAARLKEDLDEARTVALFTVNVIEELLGAPAAEEWRERFSWLRATSEGG